MRVANLLSWGRDYVKNRWEQPGTVTRVHSTQDGQERISIRWDDGGVDVPLNPAPNLR
jgi:hypothetical protein